MVENSVPDVDGDYDEESFGNFKWLGRRDSTYNSFSQFASLPACSFEWGSDGYAGCTNYGGELLYLSAPSREHGLMQARGTFSSSTYATLSRTQVEFGGSSTFGLEIALAERAYNPKIPEAKKNGSSFRLGDMVERGCFNYRWPFNEYYLDLFQDQNDTGRMLNDAEHVGICRMLSCSLNGIFYQVLRIESEYTDTSDPQPKFPSKSQVVLTIGGPVWFRSFLEHLESFTTEEKESTEGEVLDTSTMNDEGTTIRFMDVKRGIVLEIQVFEVSTDKSPGQHEPRMLKMEISESAWDSGTTEARRDFAVNTVKAYNAIVELPENTTSATFLARIRFIEGHFINGRFIEGRLIEDRLIESENSWPSLPNSMEMYKYVGVSPLSLNATSTMWKTILADRRERREISGFVMRPAEFDLVGRALEKILQVDIIPAYFSGTPDARGAVMTDIENVKHASLVSNLFLHPNVDLLSLFWKIRFLVKIHQFLSRFRQSYSSANTYIILDLVEAQLSRIEVNIQNVTRYLFEAFLESGSSTILMPDEDVRGESNYYYVMITIWYVINHSTWNWTGIRELKIGSHVPNLLKPNHLPADDWVFKTSENDKVSLLRWYHYVSIAKLYRNGILPETWGTADLDDKVSTLAKEAKMVAEAKLSSRQPYTMDDEIYDRLAFLSDELDPKPSSYTQPGTIASLSMKRIRQRDNTRYLNPGWLSRSHEGSTWGPWEIYALCHHTPLVVYGLGAKVPQELNTKEYAKEEIESIKRNILHFMNGEGTIIPSWERSQSNANNGLLRSEATAVVASALLMIDEREVDDILTLDDLVQTEGDRDQVDIEHPSSQATDLKRQATDLKSLLKEISAVKSMIKDQGRALEKDSQLVPIKWMAFALPYRYHPRSFFNSLESTPETYQRPLANTVALPPSLVGHATTSREKKKYFDYKYLIPWLKYFTVFDITVTNPLQDDKGFTWKVITHESNREGPKTIGRRTSQQLNRGNEKLAWALYRSLVDQEIQHRFLVVRSAEVPINILKRLNSVINTLSTNKVPPDVRDLLISVLHTKSLSQDMQRDLLEHIQPLALIRNKMREDLPFFDNIKGESLGRGIPQKLLELLVYVLHPESAECLGNHVLKFSKYSSERRESQDSQDLQETWVTSITLRSWRVACTGPPPTRARQTFSDSEPIYLPQYLERVWASGQIVEKTFPLKMLSFELCTSSIVMSTNAFGDFSKCTIVSDFLDNRTMERIVEDGRQLWNKFIHQPQTARCLVFLLILTEICQHINQNYEAAIKKISPFLELHSNFDPPKDKPKFKKQTPFEYRLLIWGIDALQKWQIDLESSIDHIDEAKKDLMAQIADGPGNRHPILEKMCQQYIRDLDFESALELLTTVNKKLKRTIELKKNHQETFFSLQQMEDSQTSLRLQEGVSRLTYLTIVYLPPALIAAIFTIPLEQNMISQYTGWKWFIASIFILSVGTYFLAFYIQIILDFLWDFTNFFVNLFTCQLGRADKTPRLTSPDSDDDETSSSSLWSRLFEWEKADDYDLEGKGGLNPGDDE